nr:uncharacterized protein LOC114588249 isoform X1 [Podarcis muralis]
MLVTLRLCAGGPQMGRIPLPPPRDAVQDSPLSLDYEAYESNTLGDFRDLKEFPKMDIGNSEVVCRRTPNGKNLLAPQRDAGPDSPLSLDYEAYESDTLGDSGHLKGVDRKITPPADGQGPHGSPPPPPPVANMSKKRTQKRKHQGCSEKEKTAVAELKSQLQNQLSLPSLEKEAEAVNVCSYSVEAARDAKQVDRKITPPADGQGPHGSPPPPPPVANMSKKRTQKRKHQGCSEKEKTAVAELKSQLQNQLSLPSLEKEAEAVNVCSYSVEAARDAKQIGLETESGIKSPQRESSARSRTSVKETPGTPSEPHTTPHTSVSVPSSPRSGRSSGKHRPIGIGATQPAVGRKWGAGLWPGG